MSNLIWQPKNMHLWPSIDIEVSHEFAVKAYNYHISSEERRNINNGVREILIKQFGNMAARNPLEFHEDTYLINKINLTELKNYSTWIPLSVLDENDDRRENVIYKGKNIDMAIYSITTLKVFDLWTSPEFFNTRYQRE